jgi:TP901 family phage tail tape measure protein
MTTKNTVELILSGNSSKLLSALGSGEKGLRKFGHAAKQEFERIRSAATSVEGKLASLGVSVGAAMLVKNSAQMDKGLTQIGQTAGVTKGEVAGLRKELFRMSSETGQGVEDLQQGFNNAVQAGLNFKEALPVIEATNKAMAVTGANADRLTSGLTVAATAFQFDLSKPNLALGLLDKMTTAGRLGNAELQNLSDIFARVGVNASRAGMGFDQTLAFIEGLSLIERQPERLATLADSTLRLFTNLNYMKQAQKATGVKFFDAAGARRNPLEILAELKKKYDALTTDKQREIFMGKALKGADLDTIKGIQTLLKGDMLGKISGEFAKKIAGATGTIEKDLPDAVNNAIDQTGRLKAKLTEAADAFAKPIKDTFSKGIQKLIDPKEKGGMGFTGKELIAGGAGAALGGYMAYRLGGAVAKRLLGRLGGSAAGIAEGKAVEAATGVTPVFVTNWPPGMGSGATPMGPSSLPGAAGSAGRLAGLAKGAGYAGLALGGGYAVGTGINYLISKLIQQTTYGRNDSLGEYIYDLIHTDLPALFGKAEVKNDIRMNITVDQNGRSTVTTDDMGANVAVTSMTRGVF